ncbi:MAG: dihydroorotase, partial [Chloroflexi bacterium]
MRLLIKNGRVIDPQSGIDDVLDILVEEGRVRGMAPGIAAEDALIIPASGKLVTPGLIDLHVHFR